MSLENFNLNTYNACTARGLCRGVGKPDGQMCIEAAISLSMGLPFGDDPECVEPAVRAYKITLNDSDRWASEASRAAGLYDLGIAQLGSRGAVGPARFTRRLAELHIRELIPALFREVFAESQELLALADRCEREGAEEAAAAAHAAAYAYAAAAADAAAHAAARAAAAAAAAAHAANAAAHAANAAAHAAYANANAAARAAAYADAAAAYADAAAAYADAAASAGEKYLLLSADICLRVLRELDCPGVALLDKIKAGR